MKHFKHLSTLKPLSTFFLVFMTLQGGALCKTSLAAESSPALPSKTESEPSRFPPTGGMWIPSQLSEQTETLRKLGLVIDPSELSSPDSGTLSAIASLGGCSASFVSKNGLMITNHHCVINYLSYMTQSDKEKNSSNLNYVVEGYNGLNLSDERSAGPAARVFVTKKITDVTDLITKGLSEIKDPAERMRLINLRSAEIVEHTENVEKSIRADVRSFFRNEKYFLTEKLEIKDLRVVYAPPYSIGEFGGDTRNWTYPRHGGDFAFLRAYVAPDGKPAPYSPNNIPYEPKNILKIAKQGPSENDLVLVAGFPGVTNRLATAEETKFDFNELNPFRIAFLQKTKKTLLAVGEKDPVALSKSTSVRFSIDNSIKKLTEVQKTVAQIQYQPLKEQLQTDLQTWIDANPARQEKYGTVLKDMEQIRKESVLNYQSTFHINTALSSTNLGILRSALVIVRKAQEKLLPDVQRLIDYKKNNWETLRNKEEDLQKTYYPASAKALFKVYLNEVLALPSSQRPEFLNTVFLFPEGPQTAESISTQIDSLFDQSGLSSLSTRLDLLENATWDSLQKSTDPLLQFALKSLPTILKIEKESLEINGRLQKISHLYISALREFLKSRGQLMAPDANGTLRVTYGLIKGYENADQTLVKKPFTYLSELVNQEHIENDPEFHVPQNLRDAARAGTPREYQDATGDVPINFLANLDTTGGNSGSAALNAKGELIGLLFDGMVETLYSDYKFDENVRSVLLDLRYTYWILDKVNRNERVLNEINAPLNGVKAPR